MNASSMLSRPLVVAVAMAAILNLLVGLSFLLGPELGITLWPSPVPHELMRFIGSIVLANGIGAGMIARHASWENARVLVAVALVYGIVVFLSLVFDLLTVGAPPVFWAYAVIDAIFSLPTAYVFWKYERARSGMLARKVA
jgi:hypothetical protein